MINLIKNLFGGIKFVGKYDNWENAQSASTGYENDIFFNKLKSQVLKVIDGEYAYERDTVLFKDKLYSSNFLYVLILLRNYNCKHPKIIDFGGSLASKYLQHKELFENSKYDWCIIEQKKIVEIGNEIFNNKKVRFFTKIDDSLNFSKPNILLLNSVIQYIEKPKILIKSLLKSNPKVVLLERTFYSKNNSYISIQKTSSRIYKSSYPCWIFNKNDIIKLFEKFDYELKFISKSTIDKFSQEINSIDMIFTLNQNV
tara:strand:- start:21201 stop:21968 length:768 start_codon:yes stop_codon:yes gene_type:complete